MTEFTPNQIILLPCRLVRERDDGTFEVKVETGDNPAEGRVNADALKTFGGDRVYARAVIVQLKRRTITVWIPGSFAKSDGRIRLSRDWAIEHAKQDAPSTDGPFTGPLGERKLPPYWGHGWFHET